jgi:hypothetical protein
MNILTQRENDVIVAIAFTTEIVSNGILVDNSTIFGDSKLYNVFENVTVPEGVKAQEHKYTKASGFVKNEDYVPYVSSDERVTALENQTAEYMVDLDFRLSNIELGL